MENVKQSSGQQALGESAAGGAEGGRAGASTHECSRALLRLYALLSKRELLQFFALIPLLLVNSALEVIGIGVIPAFVAALIEPKLLEKIPVFGSLMNEWVIGHDPESLLIPGAITLVGVFLSKNLYAIALQYGLLRYCKGRQVTLGTRLFSAYQNAPLEFLFRRNSAEFIRNVSTDVNRVANNVILSTLRIVTRVTTVVAVLVTLCIADWKISLLVIATIGVLIILYARIFNRLSAKLGRAGLDARKDLVRDLTQGIQSIKETRVMALESLHEKRVTAAMKTAAHAQRWQMMMQSASTPLLEIFAVLGLILVVCALLLITEGDLETAVPLLSLFAIALVRLRGYTAEILGAWNALAFNVPSVHAIADDLQHLECLSALVRRKRDKQFRFECELRVDHAAYTHPGASEPTLKGITLRVRKGTTTGFAGPTGSGKTTLIDLILGIRRPDSGSVLIDGAPVDEIVSLRKHVGYVPQFIYLFDDTIRRNTAPGENDRNINDERVWEALDTAQIGDVVRGLPGQLEAMIGENGVRLSGGQRQRLGIARAIYHDPEIVVMDEGTSALDEETESALMNAIHSLHGVKTVLLIAHRRETLAGCDQIFTMQNGVLSVSDPVAHR